MLISLIVLAVAAVLVLLFVVALGRASRRLKASDDDAARLAALGAVRSPSGQAFFPTQSSAIELAEVLDDHRLAHADGTD